jgi:hypothetical protein
MMDLYRRLFLRLVDQHGEAQLDPARQRRRRGAPASARRSCPV